MLINSYSDLINDLTSTIHNMRKLILLIAFEEFMIDFLLYTINHLIITFYPPL